MRTAAYVAVALVATGLFVKRGMARTHDGREHSAPRVGTIDAEGARLVRVTGEAGDLRVVAVDGAREVRVRGTARASRASGLDEIKLEMRRNGDELVVRAVVPSRSGRSWFGGPTRRALDMVVEVPASLEAAVTDGSGDLEVRGVSALDLTDGSGNVRVSDVRGPVRLTDGSGEVELTGTAGDVWLKDGSGEVRVRDVAGSLVVDDDGSGGLSASGVRGDVLVRNDGSGDIDVSDVGGRFIVAQDGSGEVRHHDVRGGVEIPRRKKAHPR
jgi:hypothetical protein